MKSPNVPEFQRHSTCTQIYNREKQQMLGKCLLDKWLGLFIFSCGELLEPLKRGRYQVAGLIYWTLFSSYWHRPFSLCKMLDWHLRPPSVCLSFCLSVRPTVSVLVCSPCSSFTCTQHLIICERRTKTETERNRTVLTSLCRDGRASDSVLLVFHHHHHFH